VPRLRIRSAGLVRDGDEVGVTRPSAIARSSARPPAMGTMRANALPRSVTTSSSPARTRARYSLRLPRNSLIPTSMELVYATDHQGATFRSDRQSDYGVDIEIRAFVRDACAVLTPDSLGRA